MVLSRSAGSGSSALPQEKKTKMADADAGSEIERLQGIVDALRVEIGTVFCC